MPALRGARFQRAGSRSILAQELKTTIQKTARSLSRPANLWLARHGEPACGPWLALEHEHRLVVHVAATLDRAGGGLAFANEDHRALTLPLVEMILAVFDCGMRNVIALALR